MPRMLLKAAIVLTLLMSGCAWRCSDGSMRAFVLGYAGDGSAFCGIGYVRTDPVEVYDFERISSGPRVSWEPPGFGVGLIEAGQSLRIPLDTDRQPYKTEKR